MPPGQRQNFFQTVNETTLGLYFIMFSWIEIVFSGIYLIKIENCIFLGHPVCLVIYEYLNRLLG